MNVLSKAQLAHRVGARAYRNGRQDHHNPYPKGTNEFEMWLRGFCSAAERESISLHLGGA